MQTEPTVSVMAVVVVYDRDLQQVESWQTLCNWLRAPLDGSSRRTLGQLLIYDNSPVTRADPGPAIPHCRYVHDPGNGGTAAAYARAASIAHELGFEWLLLLDHDTRLPPDFLARAVVEVGRARQPVPAAFVPWVRHGAAGTIVSPTRVTSLGGFRPLRPGSPPAQGKWLSAISSGSILNVATLMQLLPFPQALWLDYVDHWIFAQLRARGRRICILDQYLQHELSVASPATLSANRLVSVLEAEAVFNPLLGVTARLVYPCRLVWRLICLATVNPPLAIRALRWIGSR